MWLLMLLGTMVNRPAAAQGPEPAVTGMALILPPVPATAAAAARVERQDWQVFSPPDAIREQRPDEALASLEEAYVEADFVRCLASSRDRALEVERLLGAGEQAHAARAGALTAACLHATGEHASARELVRRLLVLRLDVTAASEGTRPDFRALVAVERTDIQQRKTVRLTVRPNPTSAAVRVDGREMPCLRGVCTADVPAGEHVITATHLSRRRETLVQSIDRDETIEVTLDWAGAKEAATQVDAEVRAGRAVERLDVLRALALSRSARLAMAVWKRDGRFHAVLFDRAIDAVAARASDTGDARTAIRAVVLTWLERNRPSRPLLSRPSFWLTVGAVAVSSAAAAYYLTRSTRTRYDLVFR